MKDLKLWGNIKEGDVKSLNQLHSIYFYQMCLFAKKTIYDDQLAESVVSDCFIKLWENRRSIEINSSVRSYLYRILKNQIIDYYRGRHEKAELFEELPDMPGEMEFNDQQQYVKLYEAIAKLPEQRKNILELAVFDSLTYQQIADKLHISKNTVKTQISRAYKLLKELLEPRDFYLFFVVKKEQK